MRYMQELSINFLSSKVHQYIQDNMTDKLYLWSKLSNELQTLWFYVATEIATGMCVYNFVSPSTSLFFVANLLHFCVNMSVCSQ